MQSHIVVLMVTTEKPIEDLTTKIAHRVYTLEGKVHDCVVVGSKTLANPPSITDAVESLMRKL